jgi:diadenosine tetraphosphate (Ap4A) HIT family hydrolase
VTLDRNIDDKKIRPAPHLSAIHLPANSPPIPRHMGAHSAQRIRVAAEMPPARPPAAPSRPAVNPGHLLACPWRHVASFFDLTEQETAAVFRLVTELKSRCDADFRPPGYNIGVNIGRPAGQTVMHVHVHLIPRYDGDVDDPTGGVRHVIPVGQLLISNRLCHHVDAQEL